MAATVSNPFSLPSGQIGSDQQMTMCSILQEAVLSLCQANYPETTQLEVDAIICISVLNSAEQHVVKIHEKLNDNFESMYIAQNQNSSNSILGKQAVSGVVDHPEVVKVRSVASPHVDQQAFGQSLTRHNRRISGRTRMANIQKRLSDGVDSFSKRSKIDSPSNQICDIEPVKIKVEPHDDEDNSKASFGLVDDSSGEVSHLEPHPTALYRSDIPVEPPDKNARLPQSSVLLHPSRQTMSGQYPVPGPQSNQFSVGNRNVSSTVTHESELQTLTSAPDATTSHSITDVHMPIIPLDSKAEVQQVASHLDPDISADGSEQNLSQLEMVQGMEEQYLQSLPSNGEDDTEDFEDGQDMKYGEQAEASEIRSDVGKKSLPPGLIKTENIDEWTKNLNMKKKLVCQVCGKHFRYEIELKHHMRIHARPFKFKCDICGNGFSQRWKLSAHLRTHTAALQKSYHADNGISFSDNKDVHTSDFKACGQQKGNYLQKDSSKGRDSQPAKIHKNYEHNREKLTNFPAQFISREEVAGSKQMEEFVSQEYQQTEMNPLLQGKTCLDDITMTFDPLLVQQSLQNSLQERSPTQCQYAAKEEVFRALPAIMQISNDDLGDTNQCTMEEKPFSCDMCGKRFKSKFGFRCHVNSHNGLYKFCCDLCGKQYQQRYNLNEHLRTNHSIFISGHSRTQKRQIPFV